MTATGQPDDEPAKQSQVRVETNADGVVSVNYERIDISQPAMTAESGRAIHFANELAKALREHCFGDDFVIAGSGLSETAEHLQSLLALIEQLKSKNDELEFFECSRNKEMSRLLQESREQARQIEVMDETIRNYSKGCDMKDERIARLRAQVARRDAALGEMHELLLSRKQSDFVVHRAEEIVSAARSESDGV